MAIRRTGSGRPPALTARAHAWLWTGGVAIAVGLLGGHADGVRLGLGLWLVLFGLYVHGLRAAIAVWRRQIGVRWEVPEGALPLGEPIATRVVVGNRGPARLFGLRLRLVVGGAIGAPAELVGQALPERETQFPVELRPRAFGSAQLHGVYLTATDRFGLLLVEAYFPLPTTLRIRVPRSGETTRSPVRLAERPTESARPERRRARRGEEVPEIQKLRDWQPGDPYRRIAWHKTARTGRLLVRELDRAPAGDLLLLVDVGPSMRAGEPGRRPVDRALLSALRLVRRGLGDGYRIGLCLFDLAPLGRVPIGRGSSIRLQCEELIESWQTLGQLADHGLSESELGGLVGRYLLVQHGLDVRTNPPPVDDPHWARLLVSPSGELYDVDDLLHALRDRLAHLDPPGTPTGERLRRFAVERGLELGWRPGGQPVQRTRVAQTLVKLLDEMPARTTAILWSDLQEIDLAALRGLPARLGRRGCTVRLQPLSSLLTDRGRAGDAPGAGAASAAGDGTAERLARLQGRELLRRAARLQSRARAVGLRVGGPRATSHIDGLRVVK